MRVYQVWRTACVVSVVILSGCEWWTGHAVRDWTEDVPLDDGRTITIDRHVEFDSSNSLAGDAYSSSLTKSTIRFRGELATLPTWDVPLLPLVLYWDNATSLWVIVATTTSCSAWWERHRPQPPYWEFRADRSSWTEVAVSQGSFGKQTNLFIGYEPRLPAKNITVALAQNYMAHTPVSEEYRSIRSDARLCGGR